MSMEDELREIKLEQGTTNRRLSEIEEALTNFESTVEGCKITMESIEEVLKNSNSEIIAIKQAFGELILSSFPAEKHSKQGVVLAEIKGLDEILEQLRKIANKQ